MFWKGVVLVLAGLVRSSTDALVHRNQNNNNGGGLDATIASALPSHIVDSYHQQQQVSTIPPPTPKCWQSAWKVFAQVQDNEESAVNAKAWCSAMPENDQKALALEIARCHLKDLGKPLIRDRAVLNKCLFAYQDAELLKDCLLRLTDAGINAYTHYISYVQQLCTRLTAEHMIKYQQEMATDLVSRYATVAQQSLDQMVQLSELSGQHAAQLQALVSDFPAALTEQLTTQLEQQLRVTVQQELQQQLQLHLREQLQDGISDLLQRQALEQATYTETIMNHFESRDRDQQQVYESWTQYQTTLFQNQAREMARQREGMEELTQHVTATAQQMQPLLGLKSLVTAATQGYTWITFLLHFLGTFNVVWLVTRPKRCHCFRSYLFGIVVTEAVLELAAKTLCENDLVSVSDYALAIDELRRWALLLECVAYLAGLVTSFFLRQDATDEDKVRLLQDAATPRSYVITGPEPATNRDMPEVVTSFAAAGGGGSSSPHVDMYSHSQQRHSANGHAHFEQQPVYSSPKHTTVSSSHQHGPDWNYSHQSDYEWARERLASGQRQQQSRRPGYSQYSQHPGYAVPSQERMVLQTGDSQQQYVHSSPQVQVVTAPAAASVHNAIMQPRTTSTTTGCQQQAAADGVLLEEYPNSVSSSVANNKDDRKRPPPVQVDAGEQESKKARQGQA